MFNIPERYHPVSQNLNGGMGAILFCKDTTLERMVAIKFIKDPSEQRRMLDELSALMRVRSKHVVQLYDIVKSDELGLGIVQEFIDGKDLLTEYTPPTSKIDYYKKVWQIASGIHEIHLVDVIHRDIKPNNMKIDPEGVIKIYDFGLSRNSGVSAATVGFVGTQGFAAPELFAETPTFTSAIDIYALGATSLFLATGKLPKELIHACHRPVSEHHFDQLSLDEEVRDVLNKCLSHSPENRPSALKVKDTIAKYILFNQHKALAVHQGQAKNLDQNKKGIKLELSGVGRAVIEYTGSSFIVTEASGEVYINNRALEIGNELPGSCVITLGAPIRKNDREYITFDISNPEIVI